MRKKRKKLTEGEKNIKLFKENREIIERLARVKLVFLDEVTSNPNESNQHTSR